MGTLSLVYDEIEFLNTARVLRRINPSVKADFDTDAAFCAAMIALGQRYLRNATYLTCYGIVLTAYDSEGRRGMRPSIATSVVEKYLS
jgi:hypothetical protein